MGSVRDEFRHLDGSGRIMAGIARRPATLVYVALSAAVLLSWAVLAGMARRAAEIAPPVGGSAGDAIILSLPALPVPAFLETFFLLCLQPASPAGGQAFLALTAMWFLMSLAMMLPSAAPMVRTYCEIADTAAARGERVVHPSVLVAGYLAVWLAASGAFAALTLILSRAGVAAEIPVPLTGIAAVTALAMAGAYQFSRLKQACLEKCRNPFAVLFANWSVKPARVFRLGMRQGLWCLGCCWALMLVMFAVGLMNLFWMALVGIFAIVEKQVHGAWPTRLAGGILLVWAAALLVVSV